VNKLPWMSAGAARQADESVLDAAVLDGLVSRYRALAAVGLATNLYRRTRPQRTPAGSVPMRTCPFGRHPP